MAGNTIRLRAQLDDEVSGRLAKIRDQFDRLGANKGAQSILHGVGISAGVTAMNALGGAMSSMVSFAGDAIAAASDLGETVSKGRVIFGESAAEIESWAETASQSFGQSKRQAIDAAASFATFGRGAGLAGQELVGFSTKMTELASDMASFSNTTVDESIAAIGAALRGESEPIRKFGVLLDDATLRQIAFEKGLISSVKQGLTPAQKSLAAYEAILRQTGDAQGDFDRTSDGLANTQRTLAAQMEDLTAEIGEALLPVAVELANVVADDVVPTLRAAVDAGKQLGPVLGEIAGSSLEAHAALGQVADGSQSVEERIKALGDATVGSLPILGQVYDWAIEYTEAAAGATEATGDVTESIATLALRGRPNLGDIRSATLDMAAGAEASRARFEDAMAGIVTSMGRTRDELKAIVDDAVASVYDPLKEQARLTSLEFEIAAQRRILADKDATAAEKANAKERLLSLREERESLQLTMVLHGELDGNLAGLAATWTRRWAQADAEGRVHIDSILTQLAELRRATEAPFTANFSVTGQAGSGAEHRAHGGPVFPGRSYLVGERGPELLTMGSSAGYVNANTGGGGISLSVSVNGVNDPEEIARRIVQPLRRELARQGMSLA